MSLIGLGLGQATLSAGKEKWMKKKSSKKKSSKKKKKSSKKKKKSKRNQTFVV